MSIATMTSWRSRTSPIGVDMGQRGIRMAQLTCTRGLHTVSAMTRTDFRSNATEARVLSGQISNCLHQTGFTGRNAVLSLCSPDVSYFALELPPVTAAERANIAQFEVQRLVAERSEEVEIRHWSLPQGRPQSPSALGLAAPRAAIEKLVLAAHESHLWCVRMDTGEAALCRLGALLIPERSGGVWGVLDYGHQHVRLILCVDEVPVLIRVVGPGGGVLTSRLAESLQISEATAEVQKSAHGITEPVKTPDGESGEEIGAMHFSILRTELQSVAAEIKRSYEYVLSCYPGRKALDLVLTGGGARLKNLDAFLAKALGITVRCASSYLTEPTCPLRFASGKNVPLESMARAIGLAITDER